MLRLSAKRIPLEITILFLGLVGCAAAHDDVGSSTADVETESPLANVRATKIADLRGGPNARYSDMRMLDATHLLVESYGGPGIGLELVDTTSGATRDLGWVASGPLTIELSPNRKWILIEDGADVLRTAPLDGPQPLVVVGTSPSYFAASPWPEYGFAGDVLITSRDGVLRAVDPGTARERWQITFDPRGSRVFYAVSPDNAPGNALDNGKVFAFTRDTAKFIDLASGQTRDVTDWPQDADPYPRLLHARFEPNGQAVLAIRGTRPNNELVRFPIDGGPMQVVDTKATASVDCGFTFSPDGKKVLYRVISGPPDWFTWPNGFVIRDLATNEAMPLSKDWLRDQYLDVQKDVRFLADGHTVYVPDSLFVFDFDALGAGPTGIVPADLRDPQYPPSATLTPGEGGFVLGHLKVPGTYFRRRDTGLVKKLGFAKGELSSIEPLQQRRQSAIVNAYQDAHGVRGQWLLSLTHRQKCTKLATNEFAVAWANGYLLTASREGFSLRTSDGRFSKRVVGPSTGYYDGVATAAGKTAYIERDGALYRIDLPDYTSPLLPDDAAEHPENACDQE